MIAVVVFTMCVGVCAGQMTGSYHDYASLSSTLNSLAADTCPTIARVFSVGTSVLGKELYGLRLTRSPSLGEDSSLPAVRLAGNMHGDETVGREFLLGFAKYLCTNYGTDVHVTWLVDHTQIYLIPSLNPDGFAATTRENANGIDLNRDYPSRFSSKEQAVDTEGRQAETIAMMDWSAGRTFALAANYHGGAVVASYPWDGNAQGANVDTPTPDNDLFVHLATVYAQASPRMQGPEAEVDGGVTNGADWYSLIGSLQDWTVVARGVPEITLEVSRTKTPPGPSLPDYWADNYVAAMQYVFQAQLAVAGRVVAAEDGSPLAGAECILDSRPDGLVSRASPVSGRFWRLALPGEYSVTCSAPGRTAISKDVSVAAYTLAEPPTTAQIFDALVTFSLPKSAEEPEESGLGATIDSDSAVSIWVGLLLFVELAMASAAVLFACINSCGGCRK